MLSSHFPPAARTPTILVFSPLLSQLLATQGQTVASLADFLGQNYSAAQTTGANRPVYSLTVRAGLRVLVFDNQDHMRVALGAMNVKTVFGVAVLGVESGRSLLARDTSQGGTSKPAFEIVQET